MNPITVGEYVYNEDEDYIGEGSFGSVYRGSHFKDKSKKVAIKRISLKKAINKQQPSEIREREAKILKDLSATPHQNLIRLIFHETRPNFIFFVMEFCNGGNLREYLRDNGLLSEFVIRLFFLQIGTGLKFLHDMKIVHRDLKPDNILLHFDVHDSRTPEKAVLKIADFGLGKDLSSDGSEQTDCGTDRYRAPEVRSKKYSLLVDLWSIGVMIYECLGGTSRLRPLQKLEFPKNASQDIRNLLGGLVVEDPRNRINSDQFLNHSFIRELKIFRDDLKYHIEATCGFLSACNKMPEQFTQTSINATKRYDEIENEIQRAAKEQIALVQQHRDRLLTELNSLRTKKQEYFELQKSELSSHINELETFIEFADIKAEGYNYDIRDLKNALSARFTELKVKQVSIGKRVNLPITATFTKNVKHFEDGENCIGSVHDEKDDKTSRVPSMARNSDHLDSDKQLARLSNLGNTSYLNSALKTLSETHALFKDPPLGCCDKDVLVSSFLRISTEIQFGGIPSLFLPKIYKEIIQRLPRFTDPKHDHECLRHLLDEIRKEKRMTKTKADYFLSDSSPKSLLAAIDKIFGGHLITVYICMHCNKPYHVFEPFLDISLSAFLDNEKYFAKDKKYNYNEAESTPEKQSIGSQSDCKTGEKRRKDIDYNLTIKKLMTRLADPCEWRSTVSLNEFSSNMPYNFRNQLVQSVRPTATITLCDLLENFSRKEYVYQNYPCADCLTETLKKGEVDLLKKGLKLTSATKQSLIFNPPLVLTIHFKRFERGSTKKNRAVVKYSEFLDIAPYCSAECLRNYPPKINIWYSLYAVIVAPPCTFLDFGHYSAYVKTRDKNDNYINFENLFQQKYFDHNMTVDELIQMINESHQQERRTRPVKLSKEDISKWYSVNNWNRPSFVRVVDEEEVLKQEAYLLFYVKCDRK